MPSIICISYCISNIDDPEVLVEQLLHDIMRFYMTLSYPVSNERAHYGWAQEKISNIGTPIWSEKAVLRAFVVNRVQKEYPHVLSQMGKSCPPHPHWLRVLG